jgi:hypothetical protein
VANQITVGNFASAEGTDFNGIIDEIKIYRRPLSDKEIQDDFEKMSKSKPEAAALAAATPLPEVKLVPLQKRRVAIFSPDANFPSKPVRDIPWFEEQLGKLGLQSTKLSASDLINPEILNAKRFDTLILPSADLPFEAEYSVYQFLSGGGNLLTVSCTPTTYKAGTDGKMESKQHRRGWFAPFLIRHLDFPWAQRKVTEAVGLNPAAAQLVGNLLPPSAGPYPQKRYSLFDRWDLHPAVPGREGDTDVSGGENVFLAADIMLPLYQQANREPTNFFVYRYFNNHLFGATLVELGAVGSELLASEKGADVLKAVLHLAESKLPGEGAPDYYKRITQLHLDWSKLGDTYVDTLARLRDAAYFSYLNGSNTWQDLNRQAKDAETRMADLIKQKKAWDQSLLNNSAQAGIDRAAGELNGKIVAINREFLSTQNAAKAVRQNAKIPAKVPLKSPYGKLLVEAYLTLPTNLEMFRTWHFPAMKKIGVNVYSGPMHPWYAADPASKIQMNGIARDLGFQYGVTGLLKPSSGELNPANGTVKDAAPQNFDYAKADEMVKKAISGWQGYPTLRIGLPHETGLGLKYWGTQAQGDFQKYLSEQYSDIAALNKHWGTKYPDFAAVKLPVRQPVTAAEHACWEHWRNLREAKFEGYLKFFYDTVKKNAPQLAVSSTVSTGSLESCLYGVNFYNVSRYQDISGIDGTAVNPPKEWLYLDLTKKPVLTSEWGGLYHPTPLAYVNAKLWEELTGGSLGFNLWLWQFGNHECNYVNFAGLTTLYGSQARVTVADATKIEHVILDGKRVNPEIGILFSQTTRSHDQGWGGKGDKTFSPHVQAVTNYYAHFLKFHRSARVIAEEKLLEEDISYLKMLIVPQATFLSEKVQQKLLEYVKNGGKLMLEGRAGQFDNFGLPLDLLFRSAEIAPSYVTTREVKIDKSSCQMAADDPIFAPKALAGKGRVLIRFGSEPAVLVEPLGKGEIIVAGFGAGLRQYPVFPSLLDTVWRDQKLTPRFIVSDDTVLLREWKHGADTYLMLTSRHPETVPLEVKVRGKCRIEDYLFSQDVKSKFDGSYTVFKTLIGNGGRIFRIPGGAPADSAGSGTAAIEKTAATAEKDGEAAITLPFRGRIYAETALKWGEYTFSNSTIASGIDADKGETYIIISKGAEVQKKRVLTGIDYYFRMRDKTFKVRSSLNFYKFPFHSEVLIEEVKKQTSDAGCEMNTQGKSTSVSTGLLQLKLEPNRGGRINEISLTDDQINQVTARGFLSACTENIGAAPGPFADQPFELKTVKNSKDEIVLELANPQPIDRKTLRKTLTFRRGVTGFDCVLQCINRDERPVETSYELRWHPELAIGGLADEPDMFVVPTPEGMQDMPYRAIQSGVKFKPGADWAAVIDRKEKLAFVTTFRPEQVGLVYLWQDSSFYDLEIFSPRRQVKSGESIDLNLGIYLLRGLSGLDVYRDGFGAHAALPENFDQRQPVRFTVEVGSVYEKIQPVKFKAELQQDKRTITDFGGEITDTVAFDQPINRPLQASLDKYADGDYQLQLTIKIAENPALTIKKVLHLAGTERAEHLRYYEECKKTLESLAKASPSGSEAAIFNLRVSLEEFRGEIAAGRLARAAALRAKLADALTQLKNPSERKDGADKK